jgi:hypothetical protein
MYTNLKIIKRKVTPKIKIVKVTKKGHSHNDGVAIRNRDVIKPMVKKKTIKKKKK